MRTVAAVMQASASVRYNPILRIFRTARINAITHGHPGRVLDVGCGDGSFLEALARQGWQVFGTELSESIAFTARKRLGEGVRVGAINELGFVAASFDLVTFWHVLEHRDDPKLALAEAPASLEGPWTGCSRPAQYRFIASKAV
jgi:2-polyprenyl-3-methyl-5-hydroxy-6-metoxy-1,4-benzoquinol methylase